MDNNWVSVYTCGFLQKAELIKSLLTHNEIPSVVLNHQDSLYKFGDIQVLVASENVVKAKYIIDSELLNS